MNYVFELKISTVFVIPVRYNVKSRQFNSAAFY